VLRVFRKFFGTTEDYEGDRFFVKRFGRYVATPLLITVIVIETMDLVFAMDSIPAAFSITLDKFVLYTSNIFAVLGLRSLYFALAGIMPLFKYLKYGLFVVLTFIGIKMLLAHYYKIPTGIALGVVASVLIIAVVASVIRNRKMKDADGTVE
jgi:tellurite resistance protein TerC